MQPFDEKVVRAGILATVAAGGFQGAAIRTGQEGGEIRPPCVTVVPPEFDPLAAGEGRHLVTSALWSLYLYVVLDSTKAEDMLADLTRAVVEQLAAVPTLGGTVAGSTVTLARQPTIVLFDPVQGTAPRKMLRRELTLETNHR